MSQTTSPKTELNDAELSRYSRQLLLPELDYDGQLALGRSHAVIFGLGGLGSPAAMYLASAGIGTLTLVDFDDVDDSNLQRQIVHRENRVGQPKAVSAKETLKDLNRFIEIRAVTHKLDETDMAELISTTDVVLDCTDNFKTRFALNRVCFRHKIPLVSGAAIRWEGQLATYDFRKPDSPCYQCLYKDENAPELTCSQNGVLAPVVGMIGSMQAIEAIKVLANLPTLSGRLMIVDALSMQIRTLNLGQDTDCVLCGDEGA